MTPANPDDARYTLTELADLAGVTPRTVRYYIAQGLLPSVGVSGPGVKYDDTHLARLRLIRRLQGEHQPLADIRKQLDALDEVEIQRLAEPGPSAPTDTALDYIRRITREPAAPPRMAQAFADAPPSMLRVSDAPAPYVGRVVPASMPARDGPSETTPRPGRSQWERIGLTPDIELHIRRPLSRSTAKRVDRLIEIARDLLEEDLP